MGSQPLDGVGKANSIFVLEIVFKAASLVYSKIESTVILWPKTHRRLKGTSKLLHAHLYDQKGTSE